MSKNKNSFVDWNVDKCPKSCACGYVAYDELDAIFHAAKEHNVG